MKLFEQSNSKITIWQEFQVMGESGKHVILSSAGLQSAVPNLQSPQCVFPFLHGDWLFWFEVDNVSEFRAKYLPTGQTFTYQAHRNLKGNVYWVTNGRYVLSAHIALFGKYYDPIEIIGVIFDTQTKTQLFYDLSPTSEFVLSGSKVLDYGGINSGTLWIKNFYNYGYQAERIKSLVLDGNLFRITWDGMQLGTSGANSWRSIEWTRWTRTINPSNGVMSVPERLIAQAGPLS